MNSPNAPLMSDDREALRKQYQQLLNDLDRTPPEKLGFITVPDSRDQLIASLREQLSCAQSEAKFAREHLEREREKFAEITKDARAIRAYYATAHTMGFVNAPFWHELANETKQLYRDHIARSPALASLPGGERV
jgi:chromosome segregation ATPase